MKKSMKMISPTGLGIRSDGGGDGHFGAPRTKTKNKKPFHYEHKGTDFLCKPGQDVVAPVFGKIVRIAYPYPDKEYSGLVIDADWIKIKLFYIEPIKSAVGKTLYPGEQIGIAQDISKRYPDHGILAHVHLEIIKVTLNPEDYLIDPTYSRF